jgi:hypothetical protein
MIALALAVPPPADPVVATYPDGSYAVAAPAFDPGPVIAGDSVAFAVADHGRDRLFGFRAASADGTWRTLYTAPRNRPGLARSLAASGERVVAVRDSTRVASCVVGGECSPPTGAILGGSARGRLRRIAPATERLPRTASCRRRIAQLESDAVAVSGARIAYARRLRCLSPRRRGHSQIVVRTSGNVRVVHRGRASGIQLAGRYLAFEPERRRPSPVVVFDLRARRVAYRARVGDWYSLGSDGTLATALFSGVSFTGRLAWYSPGSPRRHRLPNRVAVFSAAPLVYANGRIAFVRRYDAPGAVLALTDLQGHEQTYARFTAPEELEAFAFDGTRLAFAHTRYRPDQGAADDGLKAICADDQVLVQASATVIEVHSAPGRVPEAQLPSAAPYRSSVAERPDCRED